MSRKTVCVAGAGDVAKFFVEALEKDGNYNIVVLSRAVRLAHIRHYFSKYA